MRASQRMREDMSLSRAQVCAGGGTLTLPAPSPTSKAAAEAPVFVSCAVPAEDGAGGPAQGHGVRPAETPPPAGAGAQRAGVAAQEGGVSWRRAGLQADVGQMFVVYLQTQEEMAEMEADVEELEAGLQAKTASLKLAHTRLERRSGRAGADQCRDQVSGSLAQAAPAPALGSFTRSFSPLQVTAALVQEVAQVEASILVLEQKQSEAK